MNDVLQTLIDTEMENRKNGDIQLKYISKEEREFRALIALNIMVTKIATAEYRIMYISTVLEKEITSTKELTVAQVYGLLKYLESETHDESRPF